MIETPMNIFAVKIIGTVEVKYTDEGREIILYFNCKLISTYAKRFPKNIPITAKKNP